MSEFPSLPKQYDRKESKIDSLVLGWFAENWPRSCAIEVKVTGGKVRGHQALALAKVASGKFCYKIPDMGKKNPFDGFVLKDADAFVVTCEGKTCEVVDINNKKFIIHV
jgi:hypothetical protein